MNEKAPVKRRKRALTVTNILEKKRNILPFDGRFKALIGQPELQGGWIIWGGSGVGKTTFTMQLAKYLTNFERVVYNSLEEGDSETIKKALIRAGMKEVGNRFHLLDDEPMEDFADRLRAHKSPKVAIIDSIQFTGFTYRDYVKFSREFKDDRILIWLSHEEGKLPEGKCAKRVRHNSHVKIRVEGYQATAISRYADEGSEPYIIWDKGAKDYHGY